MAFQLELVVLCACVVYTISSRICDVRVPDRVWPTPTVLIPVNSTVLMNCTANLSHPHWSIDIPGESTSRLFTDVGGHKMFLNRNGLYNLQEVSIEGGLFTRLRLLINNTEPNNQTVVKCIVDRNEVVLKTTLFIYEPSLVMLEAVDTDSVQSSNISWSSLPLLVDPKPNQTYTLSVTSPSIQEQRFLLYEPYYLFTAPEGAPLCEVYNFSVTATYDYVGVTYTGAGCSVPSPVLSTMLPSLPNISQIESSLNFVLKKLETGFLLNISIEPASYCAHYPTVNYTVEVNNTRSEEIMLFVFTPSAETFTVSDGLSENAVNSFRILVANTFGIDLTREKRFYTTDVQSVSVTLSDGVNASSIVCEFVTGSNAMGCMVVLTSDGQKATYNLTRSESVNFSNVSVILDFSQSCIDRVEAFDIEADGSVGSVAIPGEVRNTFPRFCTPTHPSPSNPGPVLMNTLWIWITIGIIIGLVLCVLIAVSVVAIKFYRSRVQRVFVMEASNRDILGQDSRKNLLNQPQELDIKNSQENVNIAVSQGESACTATPSGSVSNPMYGLGAEKTGLPAEEALYDQPLKASVLERTPGDKSEDCKTSHGREPSTPVVNGLFIANHESSQYATVNKLKVSALERTPGDVPEDCKTSYGKEPSSPVVVNGPPTAKCEGAQCTTVNNDHIYFTLEPRNVVIPGLPSPLTKDTSSPPQPTTKNSPPPVPIYQEITEVRTSRKTAPTGNGESIPNTSHSSSSPPLIQRSPSDAIADSDTQKPVG